MADLRIATLLELRLGYDREVLHGVKAYMGPERPWRVEVHTLAERTGEQLRALLDGFRPHGVIARVSDPNDFARFLERGVAVVNVSSVNEDVAGPRVHMDNDAVGRAAAEHLLDRGFRHFASLHFSTLHNSRRRRHGFVAAVEAAGRPTPAYLAAPETDDALGAWLSSLVKPVGLYVDTDPLGLRATEVARAAGLKVPDEVALVSTDNDDVNCDFARPPMSSIDLNARRIGYEAAALLDRLMAGDRAPDRPMLMPPLGVVVRESSDVLAVEDEAVASVVRFVRENAVRPISVEEVLKGVPLSRRWLERRFRRALGRSIHDEIRRVHVERAKELLATTDLPMKTVARRAGFPSAIRLSIVFKDFLAMTPLQYRRQSRLGTE